MSSKLTRQAYAQLIAEDIAWLVGNTSRCLERDHIVEVLERNVSLLYPEFPPKHSGLQHTPEEWREIQRRMDALSSDEVVCMASFDDDEILDSVDGGL